MSNYKYIIATVSLLTAMASVSQAEDVEVPVGAQSANLHTMERPAQGMDGDQVLAKYGNPMSTSDSVGDPPITAWKYEHFTVYFEYNRVIHTVLASH